MGTVPDSPGPKFTFMQGVIVGVVALLVFAILWPVTTDRGYSGRARCLSNLKQVVTTQMIYAADWDDTVGPHYSFDGAAAQSRFYEANIVYPKNPSVFLCAESPLARSDRDNFGKHVEFEHFPLILRQIDRDGIIHLDKIDEPDKVVWMHDPILKIAKVPNGEEVETNHKKALNSFNVSFFDGHAKFASTLKGGVGDAMSTNGVWLK